MVLTYTIHEIFLRKSQLTDLETNTVCSCSCLLLTSSIYQLIAPCHRKVTADQYQ